MSAPKVAVVYYSMYGHIKQLALKEVEGAKAAGADVTLLQIRETLPQEVLDKMHAPPKDETIPYIEAADLPNYDAIIFGAPTRYGNPASQYHALWDATGQLWAKGLLNGKIGAFFTSTGTQNGGQETTHLTQITRFVHHGMIFVPSGYGYGGPMFDMEEIHGGSPWGASTYAGADGSRQPTDIELGHAFYQGKRVAEFTAQFKRGALEKN